MSKERIDIIIDTETLGVSDTGPIIQVGMIAFDIFTGQSIKKLNKYIKLNENITVELNTLKWWLKTNPNLLSSILNNKDAVSLSKCFDEIKHFIDSLKQDYKDVYLWGNGILFDNAQLKKMYEIYGNEYPIFYRNDRDMRTLRDLYKTKMGKDIEVDFPKDLIEHDALNDCERERILICAMWKGLTK